MRPDFSPLFQDVDILRRKLRLGSGGIVPRNQPREMQRAGQSGGPRADNQDVGIQSFSLYRHACALVIVLLKALRPFWDSILSSIRPAFDCDPRRCEIINI
jgi:hypothetical protein